MYAMWGCDERVTWTINPNRAGTRPMQNLRIGADDASEINKLFINGEGGSDAYEKYTIKIMDRRTEAILLYLINTAFATLSSPPSNLYLFRSDEMAT